MYVIMHSYYIFNMYTWISAPSQDKTLNCCNELLQWSWKIRCLRFIAHSCVWPHVSSSSVSSHHNQASHTNFINIGFQSHLMSSSNRPGPSTFRTFLTFSKKNDTLQRPCKCIVLVMSVDKTVDVLSLMAKSIYLARSFVYPCPPGHPH